MNIRILLLSLTVFFYGCKQDTFKTEESLLDYLKEEQNGYIHHKSVNGYDFTLMYKPTDLLVNQEIENEKISKEIINELKDKYNKYMYFNLSMSKNNQELLNTEPKSRNEFAAMVNQLAFGMNEKVHLFTKNKDTIEMTDFIYPRMYGMSKATSIMFVFPRDEDKINTDYLNFTIEDLGLYTGEMKFRIKTKVIKNQPQLSFNK